jgi:hypothetical protein
MDEKNVANTIAGIWLDASGTANTFIAIGVLSVFFQLLTIPMLIWGKSFRRWTLPAYSKFLVLRDGI